MDLLGSKTDWVILVREERGKGDWSNEGFCGRKLDWCKEVGEIVGE